MKKIFATIFFLMVLFYSSTAIAQDLLKGTDLKTINVDYLSDSDIAKVKSQLETNNMTIDQAEPIALAKGMSATEFAKLKKRLESSSSSSSKGMSNKASERNKKEIMSFENEETGEDESSRKQEKIVNEKVKDSINSLVFGSELFDNPTLNFQPNLKLASPVNYVLGPGDVLQVSINGVQEFSDDIPVSVEGKVNVEYVGQISVSGLTIEAATQKIKTAVAKVYSSVRSGQSRVEVSLGRIRTIKVTLIGSKQPGNYSISSLATVYNALFMGGGPGKNGSYRNIELIRNNKVYKNIDIYRFLVSGNQSDNVGLKDNDVIRIPTYTNRVVVKGEVKRPGIFEMKKGENFSNLLNFASGFNDFAYTASVNVLQKTGKEFKVADIQAAGYSSYIPLNGDVFRVSKILNRFENRIVINGAVFRPNTYSYYQGMRFSDLIRQAEGLKEDAYLKRARIVRLKADLTTEIVNVDLTKVNAGDFNANIELKKEDIVTIYSILDFKEDYTVTIDGEVKKPDVYEYQENLTLNDIIITAGGLTGTASKRVEIARMIKAENIDEMSSKKVELFNIEITPESNEQLNNFILKPFDVINIRRMAVNEKPEMVFVNGSVTYPGKYVLATKKEKIYDIIQRAGGLTSVASLNGIKIKRPIKKDQIEDLENVSLNLGKKDSIQNKLEKKLKEDIKFATIPVNWKKVSKNQKSNANVTLLPGDEIIVSVYNETVKVTGNVLLTSEIPYVNKKGFNYYLNSVGGLDAKGWRKKAYIIYPNGQAAVSHTFLVFFRSNPKVLPGSQIVVPEKPETVKMNPTQWVSIASVLVSMGVLIVTALK
ncbi:SLBB domain-containing protein [Flavobacterium sp. WC2509]|uniref:SLBB domain-containing protein n=1 Tax=Flavobacterium sp. WC2509 TaxID=3461406 RepID=UPI004044697A